MRQNLKIMKRILLLCCILSYANLYSQTSAIENLSVIGPYKWTKSILIKACDVDGKPVPYTTYSEAGQLFDVVGYTDDDDLIIRIVDYTTSSKGKIKPSSKFYRFNYVEDSASYHNKLSLAQRGARDYGDNQRYFKITDAELDAAATSNHTIRGSLALGVLYFPFKYRPQEGKQDFSGSFNFGAAIGYTFPHKEWRKTSFSLLSCYGISNVNVDSASVSGGYDILNTVSDYTALSLAAGFMVQYEKVQAGAFVGVDRISNKNQKNIGWIYQGKPWISVGFGYSIFSVEKAAAKTDTHQKK